MGKGFDLGGLFRQAQQLQEKIANIQQELAERTVEASAGGGMVTAVVSGKLEVVQLRIEPSLLEKPDADMLRDLIVAAVNEGIRAAQRMLSEEMGKLTGGLGIKPPGLGCTGMAHPPAMTLLGEQLAGPPRNGRKTATLLA